MAKVPVVRKIDNRRGIIGSIIFLLITLFLLFFIKYKEPNPPKITVPIPITMVGGIENFEISNAGGGSPSETVDPIPTPQENPEKQPTQEDSPVETSTGTGDTDAENSNPAEEAPPNLFSGGGSGGSGDSGSGGGFGSDDGPGSGAGDPGTGGGGDRVRLSDVSSDPDTPNSQFCRIAFKLTVDSRGAVVRVDIIRKNTTTFNNQLINEMKELVKKEVKYKKKPGARNQVVYYTVTVQPG